MRLYSCSTASVVKGELGPAYSFELDAAVRYIHDSKTIGAGVVEVVDTLDLKSSGGQPPCGFESRPRHRESGAPKRSYRNADGDGRSRKNGCEHGAPVDPQRPSVRCLRRQSASREGSREGGRGCERLSRRLRVEADQAAS